MWLSTKVGAMKLFCCSSKYASKWHVRIDTRVSHFMVSVTFTPHRITLTEVTKTAVFTQFISVCAWMFFFSFSFFSANACHVQGGPRNPFFPAESFKHVQTWNVQSWTSVSPKCVIWPYNFYFTVVIHLFLPRPLSDLCFTESSWLLFSYYSRYPLRTLLNNDRENSYTAKTFVRGVLLLFSIFGRQCIIRTGVPGGCL